MGKGKRAREARAAAVATSEKKKSGGFFSNKTVKTIAAVLVVALVVGLAGYGVVSEIKKTSGTELRSAVSVKSEHFEFNNAMMAYLFRSAYMNFVNQYYGYLSYFGLDTSKNLKAQTYGTGTWFDYFMNTAVSTAKNYLYLAEGGYADGVTALDEEDLEDIDYEIETMKAVAKNYGYSSVDSYISAYYGVGIKEKDVRAVLKLETLARKQYNKLNDSYKFDAEDWAEYCANNKGTFYSADYIYYKCDNEEQAQQFAAAENYNAFVELMKAAEIAKAKADLEEGAEVDESKLAEDAEKVVSENTKTGYAYNDKQGFDSWLFDEARKEGDTYTTDTTVYMVVKPINREDEMTRDFRHILVEEEEKAKELLEQWKADPTIDNFAKLANENSTDGGSNTNGGLYENVYRGAMVTAINDWLFSDDRKDGDADVIKSDYGYHVTYYQGLGDYATWQVKADEIMKNEAYEKDYDALEEAYTIDVNNELLSKIPG